MQPAPFVVSWADCEQDVRAAQRLRYRVFADEMGARLSPPGGTPPGLDVDRFDAHCDHLLVRAFGAGLPEAGSVVGTYRVLGPAQARAAGGYYTETEFDLAPLAPLRPRALELGRSCVHPDWRLGGVIMAMWGALAALMGDRQLDTMIGCVSVGLADGGLMAAGLWHGLHPSYRADTRWHVRAHTPLPLQPATTMPARRGLPADAPPLLKGYLRCGARLLGPPALDRAFRTADLPMMLRAADLAPRYRKHLLGAGS